MTGSLAVNPPRLRCPSGRSYSWSMVRPGPECARIPHLQPQSTPAADPVSGGAPMGQKKSRQRLEASASRVVKNRDGPQLTDRRHASGSYATSRLRYITVPAASPSRTMTTRPHSETVGIPPHSVSLRRTSPWYSDPLCHGRVARVFRRGGVDDGFRRAPGIQASPQLSKHLGRYIQSFHA